MRYLPAHHVPGDFVTCESCMKSGAGLWNCFEAASRAWPDKLAMDDGLSQLSYRECLERVLQLSFRLQNLELADEQTSIILLDTSITSALATLLMPFPDGESVFVACIVEDVTSSVSLTQIRQVLYADLGLFGLPYRLEKRESLPVTLNGKIDRIELQDELGRIFE